MDLIAAMGIGGTNFKYALGTDTGELRSNIYQEATDIDNIPSQIVAATKQLRRETDSCVSAVSIACKGLVDQERGTIAGMNRRDGSMKRGIEVGQRVEEELGLPVYLENDCAAAALAEDKLGAATSFDTTTHITIGTGIGGGVVDRGHLIRGQTNFACEFGAIKVGPNDGRAQFDVNGAWEAYCSGPGIQGYVQDKLVSEEAPTPLRNEDPLTPQAIVEHAQAGDEVASQYFEEIHRYNALGCATVANLFDPGIITFGGGVALNNFEFLHTGITNYIRKFLVADPPELVVSGLGEEIGIYGALAIAGNRPRVEPASAGSSNH